MENDFWLPKSARSAKIVENLHIFFNASYTWYKSLPGCEVKVLGDNGKFLGPHQIGEILAKTPTMMKGYINNAKENAQFFDGDDGFAHTGYGNTGCGVFKRGIQN